MDPHVIAFCLNHVDYGAINSLQSLMAGYPDRPFGVVFANILLANQAGLVARYQPGHGISQAAELLLVLRYVREARFDQVEGSGELNRLHNEGTSDDALLEVLNFVGGGAMIERHTYDHAQSVGFNRLNASHFATPRG
jgi:hypothetical protein